jgi:adenosine deaminase
MAAALSAIVSADIICSAWPYSLLYFAIARAGVKRIGHGFALCQSEELTKRAAAQGVTVEVCLPICLNPRFQWYTGGGANPYAKHP